MDENSPAETDTATASLGIEKSRAAFELRTPINHVLSICEMLLEDRELPGSYHDDLQRIHDSGETLISLVSRFLDQGMIEEETRIRQIRHDLRTPVNHVIGYSELLAEQAADEGLEQLEKDLARITAAGARCLSLIEKRLAGVGNGEPEKESEIGAIPFDGAGAEAAPAMTGRILVVDDDELNRDVLSRRLRQDGHEAATAADGKSALEILAGDAFDLVLLDMIMPGMSGLDVLRRMKSDARIRQIPVIVISALDHEKGIARCIELGAEDYLAKPFNPTVLRARIGTSLEKKRLRKAEREYLARIEEEQRKSENLLLNILPRPIADRLKDGEEVIADRFPEVTVLFTDLVGFTSMSAEREPEDIVGLLNRIFSSFDVLAGKHGLEKIKTIGDAYMVVGGLPVPRDDHADAIARFAIDVMKELESFNEEESAEVALRVGIDSGPAVAGIIGRNKFIYDLWGDTVNTASRMESHGEAGRIQISESTMKKLTGTFNLTPRGEIEVKGKGTMKTWFLELE